MEMFRQFGVTSKIEEASIPLNRHAGVGFCVTLAGERIGTLATRGYDPARDEWERTVSPSIKRSCAQDVIEPIVLDHARQYPSVDFRFGVEVTEVTQDADQVTLNWTDSDGNTGATKAEYVIAADGGRSAVRESLGITMSGQSMGRQIGIYFKADLWEYIEDEPFLLWWIYNARTIGVIIALDGRHKWTYNFAYSENEKPEDFTSERCLKILRDAIGNDDIELEIQSILPWRMQARVASTMRKDRIFLAGDAVHPLPPTGGIGMNTGIGDAQNLAWKLSYVLKGQADPSILDSYEEERLPVCTFNVEQSRHNAEKMAKNGLAGMLKNDEAAAQLLETPEGADIRARMAAAIPSQREHFENLGQTFAYAYASDLITPDGTPAPETTVMDYDPVARPGHRAPAVWFARGSDRVNSVDLFRYDRFVLLAGSDGGPWVEAFQDITAANGIPGDAYLVGPDGALQDTGDWLSLYGLTPRGAVLVRPDGHVVWRQSDGADDPTEILEKALGRSLGLRLEPRAIQMIRKEA